MQHRDERDARAAQGNDPGAEDKGPDPALPHDGLVVKWVADGEVLDSGESEHGQRAHNPKGRGHEYSGH